MLLKLNYISYIHLLLILENIFGKEPIERKRERDSRSVYPY